MSINDYHMKVKKIVDVLASIGSLVEDDDLVFVTLNGLRKDYAQFRTSISVREKFPDFEELIALLISEEQRNGGTSSLGGTSKASNSRGRWSQRGCGGWQRRQNANSNVECYYCGKCKRGRGI